MVGVGGGGVDARKLRQRRIVYPKPVVFAWLKLAKRLNSPLPVVRSTRIFYLKPLKKLLGLKQWPRDFTRHTCASMWMAAANDAALVSTMLGNSQSVLLKHYRALVTRAEAKKFFALKPGGEKMPAKKKKKTLSE